MQEHHPKPRRQRNGATLVIGALYPCTGYAHILKAVRKAARQGSSHGGSAQQ